MPGKPLNLEHEGKSAIYDINVTPLVDVTLVLLIIMMVTAKIIVSHAVTLDLPSHGRPKATPASESTLFIELKSDGQTLVDRQLIKSDQALIALSRRARHKDPAVRAVIEAETRTRHGRVIRVLDVLKQLDISKIVFAVPPKSG
jgi:biopolymer transport protein ExbD